jgi:hypothetical protein
MTQETASAADSATETETITLIDHDGGQVTADIDPVMTFGQTPFAEDPEPEYEPRMTFTLNLSDGSTVSVSDGPQQGVLLSIREQGTSHVAEVRLTSTESYALRSGLTQAQNISER